MHSKLMIIALVPAMLVGGEVKYTDPATQTKEFGKVRWLRNLDTAIEVAETKKKCIFLQFQEVPG